MCHPSFFPNCRPTLYKVIAAQRDDAASGTQEELKRIEKKLGASLFKEQHGREWYEERHKTEWCTNCDSFKEVTRDKSCIMCGKIYKM